MNLHGPSVGIGAAVAIIAMSAALLLFSEQHEAELVPAGGDPALAALKFNGSPALGSEDAPITLVEFGDYQCFYCSKFFDDTEGVLLENYVDTGKVRLIFKDNVIIGPDSEGAAHGTHCASDQGLFWKYHDTLYENWNGENNGWASEENLVLFAKEAGLDIPEWSACMEEGRHSSKIRASVADAAALGLTGTPMFFVIGPDESVTQISGAQPYEVFERTFEAELAK